MRANRCGPRASPGVDKAVISRSRPCQRIPTILLAHFILFQRDYKYTYILSVVGSEYPSGSFNDTHGHGSLPPAHLLCPHSPDLNSLGSHLTSIDSYLLYHKVPLDKRKLRHRNVPCARLHHRLIVQQGLESSSPNSSPALFPTDRNTSVVGETSAPSTKTENQNSLSACLLKQNNTARMFGRD